MDWKVHLWLSLFLALMLGYFFLLTAILPSTFAYDPDWIKIGSFAEYSVDDWGSRDTPVMNGTYSWRVVAIENRIAIINETFQGTTHWDHIAIIPSSGKTTEINAAAGTIEDLMLWLTRYHNQLFLDRTFILGISGHVWLMTGEEELPFQGQTRQTLHLEASGEGQGSRTADYDKATGILMRYSWTWPGLGTVHVSLESTNIFNSAMNEPKLFLNLLALIPLFVLPPIGAMKGLPMIRRRGGFTKRFWLEVILLNGGLFAILSNFPISEMPIAFLRMPAIGLGLFLVNVGFWTGILGVTILAINRFAFSIIAKKD